MELLTYYKHNWNVAKKLNPFEGKIEIFEKLQFPKIRRKKEAMGVVCKKNGKLVARFPSVDVAAAYIAPRANLSEKYARNSIYRAIREKEMFPPFSDYFWEEDSAAKGTLVLLEPEDLKRKTPFLKGADATLKAAEKKDVKK